MDTRKAFKDKFSLICIIFFFTFVNFIWFKMDQAPPMWDQSQYLETSEILYQTLTAKGVIAFLKAFMNAFSIKAPLISALPIPFYILFGNNYISALCINIAFIILASYYLYKLMIMISGRNEALLSVFILNTFPLIFAMSREFLVEYGLMTFVIMWMFYLLKSNGFEDKKCTYALGIILGLGMLMKISFFLYILFPTLFIFIKRVVEIKKLPMISIKNIMVILSIGILISGFWYFKNLPSVLSFAFSSGYGDIAKHYGTGEVFSIKTILAYWAFFINYGISAYFFLLIGLLIIAELITFRKKTFFMRIDRTHFFFLLIWFIIPFTVFTFGVNKDYRYIAPLYPVIAILMSMALIRISRIKYGRALLFILLLFPLLNYLYISFSPRPVFLEMKHLILLDNWLSYAHPPIKEHWPNERLIEFIGNSASGRNGGYAKTTLLFNHPYLNYDNLNYYSRKNNLDINFSNIDYSSKENTGEVIARIERDSDYIVTKSDKLGPNFTNTRNIEVAYVLGKGGLNFKRIGAIYHLPDGTYLTIYKKKDTRDQKVYSEVEALKDYKFDTSHSINFSDIIRLLDYRLEHNSKGYRFIFFWECLDTIKQNYKIFVHIYSPDDNPILNADHYPHNKYPTNEWRKGEIIKDEINITASLPENFHVYIGVYEESTDVRLPVKNKPIDDPVNSIGVRIF